MANSVGSVKPIVTDGLVFCVDALDIDSYPGSGTDWNSVVGNNSGSITNAVFDPNGHFVFTSDYVICNNIASTIEDDSTGSIGFWFNFDEADGSNQYDCVFSLGKLSTAWNDNKYGVYINYGTSKLHFGLYSAAGSAGTDYGDALSHSTDYHFTWSSTGKVYINGVEHADISSTRWLDDLSAVDFLFLGAPGLLNNVYDGGQRFRGKLYSFSIYNKALTADEVLQNFNAHKSRFGL